MSPKTGLWANLIEAFSYLRFPILRKSILYEVDKKIYTAHLKFSEIEMNNNKKELSLEIFQKWARYRCYHNFTVIMWFLFSFLFLFCFIWTIRTQTSMWKRRWFKFVYLKMYNGSTVGKIVTSSKLLVNVKHSQVIGHILHILQASKSEFQQKSYG